MTVATYPVAPPDSPEDRRHRRELAQSLALAMQGRTNNVLDVTLNENATSTTVTDARISAFSVPICIPVTANAAAIAMPYRVTGTAANGSMVLVHANDANTDKTFKVVLVG